VGGGASTDDDAAIVRVSVSEPQRFGEIFRRHHLAVWRYLARLGGTAAADDLAGDVFVAAFTQRDRFDSARGSVRGWLYGIATNLFRNHARSATRRVRAFRRAAVEDRENVLSAEAAESALWSSQELDRVRRAVACLSEAHREVLVLVAWEGLSYEEVASVLKLEVGTVRSRLSRARSELRRLTGEGATAEVKR
jgi:RNA polymerase sigma-70 factor (ECF subfamily)